MKNNPIVVVLVLLATCFLTACPAATPGPVCVPYTCADLGIFDGGSEDGCGGTLACQGGVSLSPDAGTQGTPYLLPDGGFGVRDSAEAKVVCAQYIDCMTALSPESTAGNVVLYGSASACWASDADSRRCGDSCLTQLFSRHGDNLFLDVCRPPGWPRPTLANTSLYWGQLAEVILLDRTPSPSDLASIYCQRGGYLQGLSYATTGPVEDPAGGNRATLKLGAAWTSVCTVDGSTLTCPPPTASTGAGEPVEHEIAAVGGSMSVDASALILEAEVDVSYRENPDDPPVVVDCGRVQLTYLRNN